ncbi:MAG: rhodanese-like domain-containing protein [Phycisphaerales bacterium]|nr:rhodanese-like domain-containing protein [Phycisphaerales bacterium]
MISTLSPRDAQTFLNASPGAQLIDVREHFEFAAAHVPAAQLIPLGTIQSRLDQLDKSRPIVILCKSGGRAKKAAGILDNAGCCALHIVAGGTDAWIAAGLPVTREPHAPWSLERQVRLATGLLVLVGLFIPPWPYLSLLVGAGLVFAGLTNFCGLAFLLAKFPWNRVKKPEDRSQ